MIGPSDVLTFRSTKTQGIKDVTVHVEPAQDLHGYDSPWPAGGGKNLFNVSSGQGATTRGVTATYDGTNGLIYSGSPSDVGYIGSWVLPTPLSLDAGTYSASIKTPVNFRLCFVSSWSVAFDIPSSQNKNSFTLSETKTVDRLCLILDDSSIVGTSINVHIEDIQIETGSTATSFAPFSNICPISGWTGTNIHVSPTTDAADGTTYSITFPSSAGTVYGGTLDVTGGKMVVDRAMVDLGTLKWSITSASGHERFQNTEMRGIIKGVANNATKANILCSIYATITANGSYNHDEGIGIAVSQTSTIFVYDNNYTDAATFKSAMSGVKLVYELATPIVYDLTPTEVTTLLGTNNVWSDCGQVSAEILIM